MKKYRVRFEQNKHYYIDVDANSPEEAKNFIRSLKNLDHSEITGGDVILFEWLCEIDKNEEDIDGTEYYG